MDAQSRRRRGRHFSYANVAATVALVFSMTGGAVAAGHYLISSTHQLSPKVLKKLKGKTGPVGRTGPIGPQGPVGAQGPAGVQGLAGAQGPSHGYSTGFTDSNPVTMTATGEAHTLMTLNVPSGSHLVVVARLQGQTGTDGGGNNFRYDCVLGGPDGAIDAPIYRVGMTNSVENYLTYEGSYTGSGPITLVCRSSNVHTLIALSGSMVATAVGGLN